MRLQLIIATGFRPRKVKRAAFFNKKAAKSNVDVKTVSCEYREKFCHDQITELSLVFDIDLEES